MSASPSRTSAGHSRSESGIASIWAAWWLLACAIVGGLAFVGASVAARQHHLDGAADLAAVSAAARLQRGGDPCRAAAEIANANDVSLRSCRVVSHDVVVSVTESLSLPFGIGGRLGAEARAGP
jgi:secretion/DNA translocation related TadE-like protein